MMNSTTKRRVSTSRLKNILEIELEERQKTKFSVEDVINVLPVICRKSQNADIGKILFL